MTSQGQPHANAEPYTVLAGCGEFECVVDKSRFRAFAWPVESLEAALGCVADLRRTYPDARHVVYALRVGRGSRAVERSNDDGEPTRTGGFPILQLLQGDQVCDAVVAVVRWFGGVKLGTGGLARAYREAGRGAIADAELAVRHPERMVSVDVSYGAVDSLEHQFSAFEGVRIVSRDFAAEVRFRLAVRELDLEQVRDAVAGLLHRSPETVFSDEG